MNVRTCKSVSPPNERLKEQRLRRNLQLKGIQVQYLQIRHGYVQVAVKTSSRLSENVLAKQQALQVVNETLPDILSCDVTTVPTLDERLARVRSLPFKTLYAYRPVSCWIQDEWISTVSSDRDAVETMVRASLYRTVNGFPWKNEAFMRARIEGLAYRALASYDACTHDPILLGNVDELLPNPESILSSMDTDYIRGQLNVAMGRPQAHVCSNLLLYESLYRVVYALTQGGSLVGSQRVSMTDEMAMLFDAVFRTQWEDMLLSEEDLASDL